MALLVIALSLRVDSWAASSLYKSCTFCSIRMINYSQNHATCDTGELEAKRGDLIQKLVAIASLAHARGGQIGRPQEESLWRNEMLYEWRFWELNVEVGETGSEGVESQVVQVGGSIAESLEKEESGSATAWKRLIVEQNWEDWHEQVEKRNHLKWCNNFPDVAMYLQH